jgi:hypothetical protein
LRALFLDQFLIDLTSVLELFLGKRVSYHLAGCARGPDKNIGHKSWLGNTKINLSFICIKKYSKRS